MLVLKQNEKDTFFFGGYPLELVLVLKQHPKETCCFEGTPFSVGFKANPNGHVFF